MSNEFRLYSESQVLKEDEFKDITTPIDYLAKMQHYGIPTRLIDLTVDPLIALFFSVQNIDVESDSLVYVFIKKGLSKDSKHVRLLSLLPKLENYDIPFVQKQYFAIYNETISQEEIIDYSTKPAFIKYEEKISYQNNRIRNQKGTFVICNNTLNNGLIEHQIEPLIDTPTVTIRIPHEYKNLIKQELDEKYSINDTYIYPELPSVATYLIEKYKDSNFSYENKYTIVNIEDISKLTAKRISVVVVLEKRLNIQQIKDIGRKVINKYVKEIYLYMLLCSPLQLIYELYLCGKIVFDSIKKLLTHLRSSPRYSAIIC
ncbi:FRG domain-containing protein [Lysinibacillus xylanilyticus]|uniref:FRG domain-containing protein n=1 Tax=Lysinibacillus xylanilyticus TaxID=582475 RepID=UPI0022A918D3|nr:FRG domain-containing protein [Lysinibacillus xylanilyticus]